MDVVSENIINQVANKIPGKKLLIERNQRICHRGKAFYYTDLEGVYHILSGLLPSLSVIFWPEFDMREVTKKPKNYQARGRKKGGGLHPHQRQQHSILHTTTTPKPLKKTKTRKGRFYGIIRGTEVHMELKDFVEMNEKGFRKKYPLIHEYTRRILLFISSMNWTPFIAEFNVFDEQLRIGTSIDMVCLDKITGKVIFLEFKTGYANYFTNHTGYMRNSLKKLTNSPYNQAHIQLIVSVLIVMKHHRLSVSEFEMYVIRVDEECLSPHKVSNDYLSSKATKIYRDLHQHRTGEIVL